MLKSFLRKNRLSNNSLIIYYNYCVNNNDDDKIQLFWVQFCQAKNGAVTFKGAHSHYLNPRHCINRNHTRISRMEVSGGLLGDHSFSTNSKLSAKLLFLGKFCLRTKWMFPCVLVKPVCTLVSNLHRNRLNSFLPNVPF